MEIGSLQTTVYFRTEESALNKSTVAEARERFTVIIGRVEYVTRDGQKT